MGLPVLDPRTGMPGFGDGVFDGDKNFPCKNPQRYYFHSMLQNT